MGTYQPVHVNFGSGLDTLSDDKAVVSTKLLQAQNVVFTSPGSLRLRHGFERLTQHSGARRIAKSGDDWVTLSDTALVKSNALASAPTGTPSGMAGVARLPVIADVSEVVDECDVAVVGNVAVVVGRLKATGVASVVAVDMTTGSVLLKQFEGSATPTFVRCVAVGTNVIVWYLASGDVKFVVYDSTTNSVTAEASFTTAVTVDCFDVSPVSTTECVIAYSISATPALKVVRVGPTGAILATATIAAQTVTTHIAVLATQGEAVFLAYLEDGTGFVESYMLSHPALGVLATAPISGAVVTPNSNEIVIGRVNSTTARVFWSDFTVSPTLTLNWRTVDTGAVTGTTTTLYRHGIGSKPWVDGGQMRIVTGFIDPYQGTTYVLNINKAGTTTSTPIEAIIARNQGGLVATNLATRSVPSVVATANAGVYVSALQVVRLVLEQNMSYTLESSGVDLLTFDRAAETRYCTAELGGLLYIAGSELLFYDGVTIAEAGFLQFPTGVLATASAGGAIDAGSHEYAAVWAWTDAKGNVHRSAPSIVDSNTTLTIAAGTQTVTISANPLNMSGREIAAGISQGNVILEQYGTLAASPQFYRLYSQKDCPPNTPLAEAAISGTAYTSSDLTTSALPQIYTAGGVLANYPPPGCDVILTHQNRLMLISAEDGVLWFSKEYIVGEAPGFHQALTYRFATTLKPSAMASFDDKLIVFTRKEVFVLYGIFPNDTGEGGQLQSQKLPSDVGAIDWRSVIVTSEGAYFQSEKGIFLLTRSMQVVHVGDGVDYWTTNYDTCAASYVTPELDEVRFDFKQAGQSPTAQTLVLNFRVTGQDAPFGQWSTFDYSNTEYGDRISSCVVGSDIYSLTDAGQVLRETDLYTDGGTWITYIVETANIWPFGRQGFMNCRTATILGTYKSGHGVAISVAYNGDATFTESTPYTAAQIAALSREQMSHHLQQQKCAGVRVKITSVQDSQTPGEELRLSGLVLECAQKRGSFDRTMPKEARQ